MITTPLSDCAILVADGDDVLVAKTDLAQDQVIEGAPGGDLGVLGAVTPGNRVALRDLPVGEVVLQYGQPIGTSRGIQRGDPITVDNLSNEVPVVRDLPADLATPAPPPVPDGERATFDGFVRADGRVGTRNFVVVIPTSMCASHEAQQIAMRAEFTLWSRERYPNVDGVVALPHNKGCGASDGNNLDVVLRTLAAYADHPNVGAVLMIDLGCEKTNLELLDRHLLQRGGLKSPKPTAKVGIQDVGGTQAAIDAGLKAIESMLPEANQTQRTTCPIGELVMGVQCGGSDAFSGLSANPSVGHAADTLIRSGGTVILSEVPEFCGAEHLLAHRARDAAVGQRVYDLVDWYRDHAETVGAKLGENPSPGNIRGGLLNIAIKSLGAIIKGGTTRIEGTTDYATAPPRDDPSGGRGLWLMQGPGYDQESVPGQVGAGCTVVVFTTGRGTTIGNAITPVIKVASNSAIHARMPSDLDLNAGTILDGLETRTEVGQRIFETVCKTASGQPSCAERAHHREFQIWGETSVSL